MNRTTRPSPQSLTPSEYRRTIAAKVLTAIGYAVAAALSVATIAAAMFLVMFYGAFTTI